MDEAHRDRNELKGAFRLFDDGRCRKAMARYLPLAEGGATAAQLAIGWMFETGCGVERDFVEARLWYQKAADTGSAEGMFYLGMLARTEGVYPVAIAELERAATMDYMPASYALGLMYESGEGVAADEERARRLFAEAARGGHLPAQREIAVRMMRGDYGLRKRLTGYYVFAKALWLVLKIAYRDPYSEKILIPEDPRWIKWK